MATRFSIPQFIEHEAKIVGPLTFRQFLFFGGGILLTLFLYFILPDALFVVILAAVILVGGGAAFAFLRINGKTLPLFIADAFKFSLTSKVYVWQKQEKPINIFDEEKKTPLVQEKDDKEDLPFKISEKSHLKKMQEKMETRTK